MLIITVYETSSSPFLISSVSFTVIDDNTTIACVTCGGNLYILYVLGSTEMCCVLLEQTKISLLCMLSLSKHLPWSAFPSVCTNEIEHT